MNKDEIEFVEHPELAEQLVDEPALREDSYIAVFYTDDNDVLAELRLSKRIIKTKVKRRKIAKILSDALEPYMDKW